MKAVMRIAPLLLGLGVGEVLAAEAANEEDRSSPIFVIRPPQEPAPLAATPLPPTPVRRQLTELIRRDADEVAGAAPSVPEPAAHSGEVLQLEKMTVVVKKIIELPGRETRMQKFVRTGYIWEFSPTKRFMFGPHGDKVGLMFSFDW